MMTSAYKPYVIELSERLGSIGRVVTVRAETAREDWHMAVAFERDNTDGDVQWAMRNVNGRIRARLRRELAAAVARELREHPPLTPVQRAEKIAAAEAWARTEAPWLLENGRRAFTLLEPKGRSDQC